MQVAARIAALEGALARLRMLDEESEDEDFPPYLLPMVPTWDQGQPDQESRGRGYRVMGGRPSGCKTLVPEITEYETSMIHMLGPLTTTMRDLDSLREVPGTPCMSVYC